MTVSVRFQRRLNLDEVEQAIQRLEHAIKVPYPSILHLYLESDALEHAAHAAAQVELPTESADNAPVEGSPENRRPL